MESLQLTQYLDSLGKEGIPGCDCVVYQNHQQVIRHIAGYADAERKKPLSPSNIYWLYSATKLITCTAVLQLVEKGVVGLDDPVSAFLPEYGKLTVRHGATVAAAKVPMTIRHLLSNPAAVIAEHVKILHALEPGGVLTQVTHVQEGGYSTYSICTWDIPGLFSMITGVIAANGINILGAQIHTSSNGKVLDILQVNSPQGFMIIEESRWSRVDEDLRQVLTGKLRVASLVAKRQRPTLLTERPKPRFPSRVDIDNEVSSDYTVIDIYTHDKIGLLYRITSTLTDLGLYIGIAKISTKVDQVADVFYVKDIFGHKITSAERLEEIREKLRGAVEQPE